jgi:hypothetical protein
VKKSFASSCRKAGISDFQLLGHKDIKMNLRYAHLACNKSWAVDVLDKELKGRYYVFMTLAEERVSGFFAPC